MIALLEVAIATDYRVIAWQIDAVGKTLRRLRF